MPFWRSSLISRLVSSCFKGIRNDGNRRTKEQMGVLVDCFVFLFSASLRAAGFNPNKVLHTRGGKEGSFVGNIAKDLGLDANTLADRRFRIVSGSKEALFQVNQNNGELYTDKKIDREVVCDGNSVCLINLKIAVENPLEIHYVGVEIKDVNDHSPHFPENEQHFEMSESTVAGSRFELQTARDPDIGSNTIRLYKLAKNNYFELEMRDGDEEEKNPILVLLKPLDREQNSEHRLVLTAVDGGTPPKSGTLNIIISVQDINDNRPVCSKDVYSVTLPENTAVGTVIARVNATDSDQGLNGRLFTRLAKPVDERCMKYLALMVSLVKFRSKNQLILRRTRYIG
ncbi:protocadherin gamma-A11-like [Xyrauchen texanus]|uniref:protocadherin gamma-A11-like n=1 Tax=Xyrauchen texanus TaxID=154827 RepID=UPI002241CA79|nr:protocadherin gamma-A11-like [Xyrauchen texanus]